VICGTLPAIELGVITCDFALTQVVASVYCLKREDVMRSWIYSVATTAVLAATPASAELVSVVVPTSFNSAALR